MAEKAWIEGVGCLGMDRAEAQCSVAERNLPVGWDEQSGE